MIKKLNSKQRKDGTYAVMSKRPFENANLSPVAKAIYGYLMGKPDDWDIQVAHLVNIMGSRGERAVGEKSIRRGLKELENAGYYEQLCLSKKQFQWRKTLWEIPKKEYEERVGDSSAPETPESNASTLSSESEDEEVDELPRTGIPEGEIEDDEDIIAEASSALDFPKGVATSDRKAAILRKLADTTTKSGTALLRPENYKYIQPVINRIADALQDSQSTTEWHKGAETLIAQQAQAVVEDQKTVEKREREDYAQEIVDRAKEMQEKLDKWHEDCQNGCQDSEQAHFDAYSHHDSVLLAIFAHSEEDRYKLHMDKHRYMRDEKLNAAVNLSLGEYRGKSKKEKRVYKLLAKQKGIQDLEEFLDNVDTDIFHGIIPDPSECGSFDRFSWNREKAKQLAEG